MTIRSVRRSSWVASLSVSFWIGLAVVLAPVPARAQMGGMGPGGMPNAPMGGQPGGGSTGVETPDVQAEHARLKAIDGVDVDADIMRAPGVPTMFSVRDPDGNNVWIVQTAPEQ